MCDAGRGTERNQDKNRGRYGFLRHRKPASAAPHFPSRIPHLTSRITFWLPFTGRTRYNTRTIVMKTLLCSLLLAAAAVSTVHADIQEPPVANQGPTRKFGRGLSNFLGAANEIPYNIASVNDEEGSNALAYGAFKGVSRALFRGGIGFYEMITAPFPTTKEKYTPKLRGSYRWIYSGYEEFPPELGWESRYNYVR